MGEAKREKEKLREREEAKGGRGFARDRLRERERGYGGGLQKKWLREQGRG